MVMPLPTGNAESTPVAAIKSSHAQAPRITSGAITLRGSGHTCGGQSR